MVATDAVTWIRTSCSNALLHYCERAIFEYGYNTVRSCCMCCDFLILVLIVVEVSVVAAGCWSQNSPASVAYLSA